MAASNVRFPSCPPPLTPYPLCQVNFFIILAYTGFMVLALRRLPKVRAPFC